MKVIGVIPARLESTRLPQKVLREIDGKSMLEHVWSRTKQAKKLDAVMIACDDERIQAVVEKFGGVCRMTSKEHPNGTSRISEAVQDSDADVIINIQGDEPLVDPRVIDSLANVLIENEGVHVATLAVKIKEESILRDPNVVKVVCDNAGDALYFSRAVIPHDRDGSFSPDRHLKHLGLYGYRRDFLMEFVRWNAGRLEQIEKLEQLRILERGVKIRVLETTYDSQSVDTEEDLAEVSRILEQG